MPGFHKAARTADIPAGEGRKVEIEGKAIALFNAGGAFLAIPDCCPHRGGPLSEGTLQGTHVTCPWHGWCFDAATGNRVGFPEGMGKITCHAVRVEGDDVLIEV